MNIILENFNSPLPPKEFRNALFDKTSVQTSFYEFVESELEVLKVDRAKGTIANYNKLINTMKVWKPTLDFKEITLDFIEQFHKYELDEGNLESTVNKKHANLKFLIGRAVLKGKIEQNTYAKFTIKKKIEAQNKDVLTEKKLQKLHEVYLQSVYSGEKQKALRMFLFSCYTGLSYAEYDVITYADLKKILVSKNSYLLLENYRVKTGELYRVPIVSTKVIELLGNGKDFQKIFTNPLENQVTNRYLKTIMIDLNINKNMTFHRARHTFKTICIQRGILDAFSKQMMGHSKGKDITELYIHLSDENIIREMLDKWVV